MSTEAEMIVRRRLAELAGGRLLTDDEQVAVMVAGHAIWDAIEKRDRDAFAEALVCLVECWPKSLLIAEAGS